MIAKGINIDENGVAIYEWGRHKPLSDQLCWQGYALAYACIIEDTMLANRLISGLLYMEKATGKEGYLPRCIYTDEQEYDYIHKPNGIGIWDDTSRDQYTGLMFGLWHAQGFADANELWMRVHETVKEDKGIVNQDGKACEFGKLNSFYQSLVSGRIEWGCKLLASTFPLIKYYDCIKRFTGKRVNRSNYHMLLSGLYLLSRIDKGMGKYYDRLYEHVKNEENGLFEAMYNMIHHKQGEVIDTHRCKCQYVSRDCSTLRSYVVPLEDRPNSHWMWKEDPYYEVTNYQYTDRYNTDLDVRLAVAINEGVK